MNSLKFSKGFILLVVLINSCVKEESKTAFSVSGHVSATGKPVSNATVSIDNKLNLTATTDASGHFEISGVSRGDHTMKLNKNMDSALPPEQSAFMERTVAISVNDDVVMDNLKLPKAVTLFDPNGITPTTGTLKWSSSESEDFREYKLYRHSSSGLDETTGTLIHVSTTKKDTSFVDTHLLPTVEYYYRVYVMNDFGRLGGSNIVKATTTAAILLRNGSFESLDGNNAPAEWSIYPLDQITSDNTAASDGGKCIKYSPAPSVGCFDMIIKQTVPREYLVAGAKYRLTFKYKSNFNKNDSGVMFTFGPLPAGVLMVFQNSTDWKNFSYEFGMPSGIGPSDPYLVLDFCLMGVTGNWWLDDVKLEKI